MYRLVANITLSFAVLNLVLSILPFHDQYQVVHIYV